MENTAWTHNIRQLWSNTRERTQSKDKEQAETQHWDDDAWHQALELLFPAKLY